MKNSEKIAAVKARVSRLDSVEPGDVARRMIRVGIEPTAERVAEFMATIAGEWPEVAAPKKKKRAAKKKTTPKSDEE